MRHGSLFSGVGGFDLAAEWMGWENVFHCEKEKFCQQVLNYYWPKAKLHEDIRNTDFAIYNGKIDILTGGFPCQPYSSAGKRLGKEDDRHLWPEMLRAIRDISPSWIVGENVRGLLNWNGGVVFNEVQADLEAEGYEVLPFLLPACAVDAPHRRDRIWFVAYSERMRLEELSERYGGADKIPSKRSPDSFAACASIGRIFGQRDYRDIIRGNGFPRELAGIAFQEWRKESAKSIGNAIVPQVVLQIFKAIQCYEKNRVDPK